MRSLRPTLFVLASLWPFLVSPMPQRSSGIRLASGTFIDCRVPNLAYYPDPEDCRNFYHCSDWSGLQKKSCGSHLYFNSKTGVCDWPSVVQRIRPECADLAGLEEHMIPLGFQKVDPSAVRGPVRFPESITASPDPATPLPVTTTPEPRARPSVGVPARFPDQAPILLFDPIAFINRPLAQEVPSRFQPVAQPEFKKDTPLAPPLTAFDEENRNLPQNLPPPPPVPSLTRVPVSELQEVRLPAPEPQEVRVPIAQPQEVRVPIAQPQQVRVPIPQPQEVIVPIAQPQGARVPIAQPQETRVPIAQPQEVRVPIAQPQEVRVAIAQPQEVRVPIAQPQEVRVPIAQPQEVRVPIAPVSEPEEVRAPLAQPQDFRIPIAQVQEEPQIISRPVRPQQPSRFSNFRPTQPVEVSEEPILEIQESEEPTIEVQEPEEPTLEAQEPVAIEEAISNIEVIDDDQLTLEQPSQEVTEDVKSEILESPEQAEEVRSVNSNFVPSNEVSSTEEPPVEATTTTTTTSTQSTRQRFRSRQRFRPKSASTTEETESKETSTKSQEESPVSETTAKSALRSALRTRPIFNPSNRRVPLNRFRGRQQQSESSTEEPETTSEEVPVEKEPTEEEVPSEEVTSERTNLRSRFFRTRPVLPSSQEEKNTPVIRSRPLFAQRPAFRSRRPIVKQPEPEQEPEQEEETQNEDGEQKVFLVCSEGKCFDPNTQEIVDTDLKASASSNPEEFLNILDQMKILDKSKMSAEKKNHIKFLLESAKVRPKTNTLLKTNDLIEMLRSSGALDEDDLTIAKKEVKTKAEEDFGVMDMLRTQVDNDEEEEEEEEVATTLAPVLVKEALEDQEAEVTTVANEEEEDEEELEKAATLVQAEFDEDDAIEVTTTAEVQTMTQEELDQEMTDKLTMTLEAVHDEIQEDDEEEEDAVPVTEASVDEEDQVITEVSIDEEEVTELPEAHSTFNMLKNIMEHFNLNKILDHAEAGTLEEVIKEDEIIEITTTSMPETTSEQIAPVVIKEENEAGETVHVVLPVGWNAEEPEIVVSETTMKTTSTEEPDSITEAPQVEVKSSSEEVVISTESMHEEEEESSTSLPSSTESASTTTSTSSSTTTTAVKSPRSFDSSKLNRIRQRLRVASSGSSVDAVKLINQRINTSERPEFVPGDQETSAEEEVKPDAEIAQQVADRRKELFSKRTRIQRPISNPGDEPSETARSSGLQEEKKQTNPFKSRFAKLRIPAVEKSSEAQGAENGESAGTAEKQKPVRCRFFGRACGEDEEKLS